MTARIPCCVPDDKMFVNCKSCEHTWVCAHLPMELSKMARIMKALMCPKCAETSGKITVATKEQAIEAAGGLR